MTPSQHEMTGAARELVGSLEYPVLAALWQESPATVGQVLDRINAQRAPDDQLAYTTVMTVLGRLFDKDLLGRRQVGRAYEYWALYSEPELVRHLGGLEVADMVTRYGDVALAQFATVLEGADPATLARLLDLAGRRDADDV